MQKLIQSSLRRARQTRAKIAELKIVRLTVHRTNSHIYAQVIDNTSGKVLTSASTIEPEIRKELPSGSSVGAATTIGKRIAEKAKKYGFLKLDLIVQVLNIMGVSEHWLMLLVSMVWYFN